MLIAVAVFLAVEVKSLLVGESADPTVQAKVMELASLDPSVEKVIRVITIQQGPGQVMVAMKLKLRAGLCSGGELETAINELEKRIAASLPQVVWTFVEPDLDD